MSDCKCKINNDNFIKENIIDKSLHKKNFKHKEVHVDDFIKKINESFLNYTSDIDNGCNISGFFTIKNFDTKYNKKIKFNCKYDHQVYFLAFIQYCINLVVDQKTLKKNNNMLNIKQYNLIFRYIVNIFNHNKCYICNVLKKYKIKKSCLYKYYRIPNYIDNIKKPWLDLDVLKKNDVRTKKSYYLNIKKKYHDKIYIMTNLGIRQINCIDYLPIIDIKQDYIDINLLKTFKFIHGVKINDDLLVKINKWNC